MKKFLPFKRQRFAIVLFQVFLFSLTLLISGCGGGSNDNLDSKPNETASASFSIAWHETPDIQASNIQASNKTLMRTQTAVTAQAQSVNCELIEDIECIVYDGSNNDLTSATFECSSHQGTIDNIPVGSNRKFVCLGVDANRNTIYHGEVLGVTIAAGQTNDLGTIDAYYFIPTDLSSTAVSRNQIDLSWNASSYNVGVAGCNIYRNGAFLKSVNTTSTSDTGLNPSTQYCYRVSAYDAAGNESGLSGQVCSTTQALDDTEIPSTPTGLSATAVSPNQIDLSWHASSDNVGVTGYNIYRYGVFLKSVTTSTTNDTGLDPLTQYCYRVSAYDAARNESGQSRNYCVTTPAPPDTTAPTPDPMTWATEPYAISTSEISMVATTASDPNSPITYMFDFVSSPTEGSGGNDSVWDSSTNYTDSGLDPNQQYGYRVRARDGEDNATNYSSTSYVYSLAEMPKYPSGGPFSNVTENSIRVSWAANENPSGTEYYCENIDNGTNSGWTKALYWNSTGLLCDTSYEFRVRARNGNNIVTDWTALDNQQTQYCRDVNIMIGDNDGYGYGIADGQTLPISSNPDYNWIFDNREPVERTAIDGSQHTDYEPYNSRRFSFTIVFPPINPMSFSAAAFIYDVSGIQEAGFGSSSLFLDSVSVELPEAQGTFGSGVYTIPINDPSILEDGKITVTFQGGEGANPGVWNPDAIAFDFFELDIYYYGE
jgi:hypothetical protein